MQEYTKSINLALQNTLREISTPGNKAEQLEVELTHLKLQLNTQVKQLLPFKKKYNVEKLTSTHKRINDLNLTILNKSMVIVDFKIVNEEIKVKIYSRNPVLKHLGKIIKDTNNVYMYFNERHKEISHGIKLRKVNELIDKENTKKKHLISRKLGMVKQIENTTKEIRSTRKNIRKYEKSYNKLFSKRKNNILRLDIHNIEESYKKKQLEEKEKVLQLAMEEFMGIQQENEQIYNKRLEDFEKERKSLKIKYKSKLKDTQKRLDTLNDTLAEQSKKHEKELKLKEKQILELKKDLIKLKGENEEIKKLKKELKLKEGDNLKKKKLVKDLLKKNTGLLRSKRLRTLKKNDSPKIYEEKLKKKDENFVIKMEKMVDHFNKIIDEKETKIKESERKHERRISSLEYKLKKKKKKEEKNNKVIKKDLITFDPRVLIGEGIVGKVWKCRYKNREVAVKEIIFDKNHFNLGMNGVLESELECMFKMSDIPGFVKVHGYYVDTENCSMGLVMDFYKEKLQDVIKGMKPMIKFEIIKRIAFLLSILHTNKILHRDIKVNNILLDDGKPVLCDFGCSKIKHNSAFSKTGDIGNVRWAAPEALRKKWVFESDIYSYGMTVLEIITEELPWYDNDDNLDIMLKIRKGYLPPIINHLGKRWRNFIRKCCSRNYKSRYPANRIYNYLNKHKKDYIKELKCLKLTKIKKNKRITKNPLGKFKNMNILKRIEGGVKILEKKFRTKSFTTERTLDLVNAAYKDEEFKRNGTPALDTPPAPVLDLDNFDQRSVENKTKKKPKKKDPVKKMEKKERKFPGLSSSCSVDTGLMAMLIKRSMLSKGDYIFDEEEKREMKEDETADWSDEEEEKEEGEREVKEEKDEKKSK